LSWFSLSSVGGIAASASSAAIGVVLNAPRIELEKAEQTALSTKEPEIRCIWTDGSRDDLGNVGAAVAWEEGTEWTGLKYRLGRNKEVFDAELFALLPATMDDCAWTISFDNLGDKNELASKVRRLLDQARTVFRKHGMELDEQKTELALIYKANQKRMQWEIDANRWSMRWQDKTIQFNKGNTRWLGFHLDRCLNWHGHVDTCVQRALWKQQQVRRFMAAYGLTGS
jgi:hypothetical protein